MGRSMFSQQGICILTLLSVLSTGISLAEEEPIYAEIGKPVEFEPKSSEGLWCVWLMNSRHVSIDTKRRIHAANEGCKLIFKEVQLKDFNSTLIAIPLHEPEKITRHHLILKGLSLDVKLRFSDEKLYLASSDGLIFTDEPHLKLTCEGSYLVHSHYTISWIINNKNVAANQLKILSNSKNTIHQVEDELIVNLDSPNNLKQKIQCLVRDNISGESVTVSLNVQRKEPDEQISALLQENDTAFSWFGLIFNSLIIIGIIGGVRRTHWGRKTLRTTAVFIAVHFPKYFNKAYELLLEFYHGSTMTEIKETLATRLEQLKPIFNGKLTYLLAITNSLKEKTKTLIYGEKKE